MDDHAKPEPDTGQPVAPDVGSGPRDLSFLWPVLDRIRAVEIKFQGDSSPQQHTDIEARLNALEGEVAAIRETVRAATGAVTAGPPGQGAAVGELVELPPQTWTRAAFGTLTAIAVLVIAHSLVVFVYDLPTLILRVVSIAIPLLIAIWMTSRRRIRPWFEFAMAVSVALIAVGAMAYLTSLHEHTSFRPESRREWRETAEYVASIAFAYVTGVLVSGALQARSGASNRPGQGTLKVARAIVSITGMAVTTGPQIKKQVDQIQGLINTLMLLASAAMAIVTGLKGAIR